MIAPKLLRACTLATLVGIAPIAMTDQSFPGIKKLMTDEEFSQSGLQQLSPQQLQQLNQWLIRYTANEADIQQQTAKEVKHEKTHAEIVSAIDGEFHGWRGKTKFRLQNGQVWQQRYSNTWVTQLDNPKVTISRNFFGFYDMQVEGSNRVIGVRRVQ